MAKKNLSADRSGKAISSTSAAVLSRTNLDHEKNLQNSKKQLTKEEKEEMLEKFKPSGDFEKDFTELCHLTDIHSLSVEPRPKHCVIPTQSPPDTTTGKAKDEKKVSAEGVKSSTVCDVLGETFHLAEDKYDYFRPKVQVEMDEEGNRGAVNKMFVRGWRVDEKVIEVLNLASTDLEKLTVVDLWNAGLNDDTLISLRKMLSSAKSVKTLRLDGNSHVENQRFDVFLTDKDLSIENLSLKSCGLTDQATKYLSDALLENKTLLTLNLAFNKISDKGVDALAQTLKFNRTLLSLNLCGNQVCDGGSEKIAEALSKFCLTHEQIVMRRQAKSALLASEDQTPTNLNEYTPQERPPTASRSFSDKGKKDKGKKKDATSKLKEASVKRGVSSVDTTKNQKSQKKSTAKGDRNKTPQLDSEETYEFKNPLLETATEINGEIYIPGNRCLINLNLSRNKITEKGLQRLYAAMKYQQDHFTSENNNIATGLMRLSLQKNEFDWSHPTYVQLRDIMKTKDPFYKPPTPSFTEENINGT